MGKPKKKHKKAKQLPLSKEEQIFQAARDLAAEIGISYSEALGFTLGIGKSSVRCPLKPKRFYPLKIFNNAPSKSLNRWGYYYFSLFPSVCRHLPDTFSV